MRIGVWLENYQQEDGGGTSYHDKLINAIDQYKFDSRLDVCFVGRNLKAKDLNKKYIDVSYTLPRVKRTAFTRISNKLKHAISRNTVRDTAYQIESKYVLTLLKENQIKVLFYPIQTVRAVIDFPFIANNWDIGHMTTYAFPELMDNEGFERRELWYKSILPKALAVLTESESGKNEITSLLHIERRKIFVAPIFPGGTSDINVSLEKQTQILQAHNLNSGNFFLYPAQFWAHKNHYNLVHAFARVQKQNPELKLVLTGSDKGNKSYIEKCVQELNITENVVFTGFISPEELYTFYKNALALVFASFLGPTNMPLLEAQRLGCPVLCSDLPGHRETMGNGAIYFAPEDQKTIEEAMVKIQFPESRQYLIERASRELKVSKFNIQNCINQIEKAFLQIKIVRDTWE